MAPTRWALRPASSQSPRRGRPAAVCIDHDGDQDRRGWVVQWSGKRGSVRMRGSVRTARGRQPTKGG